eukprot:SAG25_NODE_301_length_10166_cov_46.413927_6_plen_183_part_00
MLAAAAAATAAVVTDAHRGYCRSTGWVSGRATTADQRQNRRPPGYPLPRPSRHSSPYLELAAAAFLPASGPPGHIPFLQPGPPGHPLCRPQLAVYGSSIFYKLATVFESTSRRRVHGHLWEQYCLPGPILLWMPVRSRGGVLPSSFLSFLGPLGHLPSSNLTYRPTDVTDSRRGDVHHGDIY